MSIFFQLIKYTFTIFSMSKKFIDWLIFIILSLIWGSSFILMKIGLQQLTAYQVAALRILSAGLVLLPITIKHIKHIPKSKLLLVFIAGIMGNLLPAFLFCIAEEKIDSGLAGTLNSLTPIFVIITGYVFFKINTSANKIIGILIAFIGSFLLLLSTKNIQGNRHFELILLIIIATLLYGFNVNMVAKKLSSIASLHIAAVALSLNAIPALLILIYTGYFNLLLNNTQLLISTGAAVLLGVLGTAIATIIFYMLVKRAGGVFATTVTYGIPFIAIGWGILYGESFNWQQAICLLIILLGVYYGNKKIKTL